MTLERRWDEIQKNRAGKMYRRRKRLEPIQKNQKKLQSVGGISIPTTPVPTVERRVYDYRERAAGAEVEDRWDTWQKELEEQRRKAERKS